VQGEAAAFRSGLEASGATVVGEANNGDWRVAVPDGWPNLRFFDLAESHRVAIRALTRDDETLEELFLRMVT
jgi:ABC-2 type transport system ATP-binding protein